MIQYAALGASDAVGIGAASPTKGYVYQIRRELQQIGYEVTLHNFGIPGARIENINQIELPLAIHENPDLVTIFGGANDILAGTQPEAFGMQLDYLLSGLQRETHAYIVMADLPNLAELPRFRDQGQSEVVMQILSAYNQQILANAQRHNVALAALSKRELLAAYISADGFHPGDAGYAVMAEVFLESIVKEFS